MLEKIDLLPCNIEQNQTGRAKGCSCPVNPTGSINRMIVWEEESQNAEDTSTKNCPQWS
jgi:hypothetical protein